MPFGSKGSTIPQDEPPRPGGGSRRPLRKIPSRLPGGSGEAPAGESVAPRPKAALGEPPWEI